MAKGYFIIARKTLESEIWHKPPLYWKVWCYLLARANWDDFGNLKRGQLFTSLDEIAEDNHWYVGYRKEVPKKSQIFDILEWLRTSHEGSHEANDEPNAESDDTETMITTAKATRGIVINIVKYSIYQDPRHYESNSETNYENSMKPMTKKQRSEKGANTKKEEYKEDKEYKELNINSLNSLMAKNGGENPQKLLLKIFKQELKRSLNAKEYQMFIDWCVKCDVKLIGYALREALMRNKLDFDYINKILVNWNKAGYTSEQYENGKYCEVKYEHEYESCETE